MTLRAPTERENEVQREAPCSHWHPHWSVSGLLLASMTGPPAVTVPCSWSTKTAVSSEGSLVKLGSLEGTFRANLELSTLSWKQSTLVSIQVGYLWQLAFPSWGNHTCMDGHLYELVHL